jgi:hypothetical protein
MLKLLNETRHVKVEVDGMFCVASEWRSCSVMLDVAAEHATCAGCGRWHALCAWML